MSTGPSHLTVAKLVFATELRGLLRDRRALFMAVVLPMLLFPAMFYGMDTLERVSEESMSTRKLVVAQDLEALPEAQRQAILESLGASDRSLTVVGLGPADELRIDDFERDGSEFEAFRSRAREALAIEAEVTPEPEEIEPAGAEHASTQRRLLLVARALDQADGEPAFALRLVHDGSDNLANEAHKRVRAALDELRDDARLGGIVTLLGDDPGAPVELEHEDVASAEDAQGQKLGSLLPLILVMILVSGGSFAALGAFSAEREEGTIETLLVQPVPSHAVAWGKWMAVTLTGVVAAVGNAASFLLCLVMGWGAAEGMGEGFALGSSIGRIALGLLLFLPTVVLLSSLLCLVSARARSFREGQHYVFPLMLIAGVLAAASTQDRITLNLVLAAIPVTGSTVVFRDILAGNFQALPALVSVASSLAVAMLALRQVAGILDDERVFASRGGDGESDVRRLQSRRALAWGWTSVLLVYLIGGRLQIDGPIVGLVLTLWVLVPLLAVLAARGTARRAAESLVRSLGLGAPRLLHAVGALLLAPAMVVVMSALLEWQGGFLPMPKNLGQADLLAELEQLSPVALVLLMGVSPGLWEELLFRGAILSGLRRDLSPARVVLWQVLLFGAVHASVHRFLPTGILGGVLAMLTLWSGRLWPAVILHASYNSLIVLEVTELAGWSPMLALGSGALGLLCIAAGRSRSF